MYEKSPGMKKIINFKDAFVKRITRMVKPYDEGRIIYDRYDIAQTLKLKTRAKRAQGREMEFAINDDSDIAKITPKELLSASKTKALVSNILGNAVLEEYKGSKKRWWSLTDDFVHSPSSISSLEKATNIVRSINICERVSVIGREKCQSLIGFHNFTGVDWGGKCVGISKKSWITSHLSLPNDDPVVSAFQLLGEGVLTNHELVDGELPEEVRPIEKFVCSVYSSGGATTISALRWELFRSSNLEDEKLPPTRATRMPISYAPTL